ncbi:sensor histidine kinase [Georgenia sp. Z1344]|uniref:sensor histidine kinase n=1 Tax=Georgenia sp. Z1344 TaxID=3416706 RepID=UPI003CEB2A61
MTASRPERDGVGAGTPVDVDAPADADVPAADVRAADAPMDVPADEATEDLTVRARWWRRALPYVFAGGWVLVGIAMLLLIGIILPAGNDVAIVTLALDAVLGIVCFGLLFVRKRWPRTVTMTITIVASTLSFIGVGALIVALSSYAARPVRDGRRLQRYAFFGVVTLVVIVGGMVYDWVTRRFVAMPPEADVMVSGNQADAPLLASTTGIVTSVVVSFLLVGLCFAVGSYVGARRALLAELQQRARRAEAVVEASTERARTAERNRIAREMHDVLAHRISLVALHSGALSHRDDLPPDAVREAAGVISSNAQLALTELRQVLGVLRADNGGDGGKGHREPPQPTMAAIDGLITDARTVGSRVRLSVIGIGSLRMPAAQALTAGTGVDDVLATLSPTVSRTAYRVLQEALTNARKHAPDAVVDVELSGRLGKVLTLSVTNPMPFPRPTGEGGDGVSLGGIVGSGSGLTGLAERTDLAGGTLDHGVEPDGTGRTVFAVRAWLPWDESVGGWRGRGGG